MTTRETAVPIADELRRAIAQAVCAPSIYNTQPWKFRLAGPAVELLADRSRALPICDPEARELTISCGVALSHLRAALRARGYDAEVDRLPDPANRDLLARVTARAGLPPTEDESQLGAAIATRHTSRAPYLGLTVPDDAVERMRLEVEAAGAWFAPLSEESQRVRLVALIMEADHLQWQHRPFRHELSRWMRPNDSAARDGIFGYTSGLDNVESHLAGVAARLLDRGTHEALEHRHLVDASPLLAVIGTDGDSPRAWLGAGEGLGRALLRAESESLRVAYLNPPVEVPELRDRVGELAGRAGFPQLILRVGYGLPGPATPRRALSDVVV